MLKNRLPVCPARLARAFIALFLMGNVAATLALDGTAPPENGDTCADGIVSRLYFGQTTPTGVVTDAQWSAFIAESVTPRFPSGFTELRAHGRWRNERGAVIDEATRILEIAHDGAPLARAHVRIVAADYKSRFAQQSVLVTQFASFQCL